MKVESAREKTTRRRTQPGDVRRAATLPLLDRRNHRRCHYDCRDSGRENARALCWHLAFRLDGANRRDARGAGHRLLHGRPPGGPLAEAQATVRLCPGGGDLFVRKRGGRQIGGLLVPRLQAGAWFAARLGISVFRAAVVAGHGRPVFCAGADRLRQRRGRERWAPDGLEHPGELRGHGADRLCADTLFPQFLYDVLYRPVAHAGCGRLFFRLGIQVTQQTGCGNGHRGRGAGRIRRYSPGKLQDVLRMGGTVPRQFQLRAAAGRR